MTAQMWLAERTRPQGMVWHLKGTPITRTKGGRRKLRLFACGCCRLIWPHLQDPRLRNAVEMAERFADGQAKAAELQAAGTAATIFEEGMVLSEDDPRAPANTAVALAVSTTAKKPYSAAFGMTVFPLPLAGYRGSEKEANALLCDLLRDIFGNPFRPVTFSRAWRTDTAVSLARTMYESHEFSAMPILADALQDAGCDNPDILDHCRDVKQLHVRGCWVVDLVLGKA